MFIVAFFNFSLLFKMAAMEKHPQDLAVPSLNQVMIDYREIIVSGLVSQRLWSGLNPTLSEDRL